MYALGAKEEVDEKLTQTTGSGPTESMLLAYRYAARASADYEHYGFPYPGTVRDQPVIWKLAVDCARTAVAEGHAQAAAQAHKKARGEEG